MLLNSFRDLLKKASSRLLAIPPPRSPQYPSIRTSRSTAFNLTSNYTSDLKLSLGLRNLIRLLPFRSKRVRRAQCIFHECYISHFLLLVDLAPNGEHARIRFSQRPRSIRELPKHSHVFAFAEEGLDFEGLVGPDGISWWRTFR